MAARIDKTLPVYGYSGVRWSTAIEVTFGARALPRRPAALAVSLTIQRGEAGIGWYDEDGLAEEIIAGPGPCTPTVNLTLWEPGRCRRVIIRNAARTPLQATLAQLRWLPLRETLTGGRWTSRQGTGMFLDQPFDGTLAESLWREESTERWRDPELRLRRLRKLVWLAWRHCPGYRTWWSQHGWHPSDLKVIEDAARIPVVTKDQIMDDPAAFSLPRRAALEASTTGSTGQPLTLRYTAALHAAHLSHVAVATSLAAPELVPSQTVTLVARGRPLRGLSATGGGGSLVVSPALTRHPDLLGQLARAYRPALLFGFPSVSASLAAALRDRWRFRAAVLASEAALPGQIEAVASIADKVIVIYGLSEGASFALRCPSCGAYCETQSLALTRLRARADGAYDIVGTAFWALGTLFISYLTGDTTTGPATPCPDCPRSTLHLADVQGRSHDALVDHHGMQHTLGYVIANRAVANLMRDVVLYDCVQSTPGRVLLRYATRQGQPIDERKLAMTLGHVAPDLRFELALESGLPAMREQLPPGRKWGLVKSEA